MLIMMVAKSTFIAMKSSGFQHLCIPNIYFTLVFHIPLSTEDPFPVDIPPSLRKDILPSHWDWPSILPSYLPTILSPPAAWRTSLLVLVLVILKLPQFHLPSQFDCLLFPSSPRCSCPKPSVVSC